MKKIIVLSAAACLSVNAASFQTLGYKGISMGGASVSNAKGDMAIYSNPALLGEKDDNFDTSAGAGMTIKDSGAGQAISDMEKLDFITIAEQIKANPTSVSIDDVNKIKEARDIMVANDGSSLSARPQAHFSAQMLNFGVGVFSSTEMTATLNVDTQKSKLILWEDSNANGIEDISDTYTNLENSTYDVNGLLSAYGNSNITEYQNESLLKIVDSNENYVQVNAVNITEVPVAYGKVFATKFGEIGVGGSLKFMTGATYSQQFRVDDTTAAQTFGQDFKITNTFGLDLGLTYKPNQDKNWVTGLVVKNINTPKFAVAGGEDYEVAPAARIGTSYQGSWWQVASDLDLTENETFTGPEKIVGGGVELTPWSGTSFRAGLKTNLSDDNGGMIYTAGLGLGMKWVSLDVAAEIGDKEVTVNNSTYREHMGVAVNLISRF